VKQIKKIKMSKAITSMIKCQENRKAGKQISTTEKRAIEMVNNFISNKLSFEEMILVLNESTSKEDSPEMLAILEKANDRIKILIRLEELEKKYS